SGPVLVVSKGDAALLELGGRPGWHFPRADDGRFAGFYPADGREAIDHLEALRAKAAGHLLVPDTAFWWLEHYGEFRDHLDRHYRRVHSDDRCVLFDLSPNAGGT